MDVYLSEKPTETARRVAKATDACPSLLLVSREELGK
jgi:hypothetical protein